MEGEATMSGHTHKAYDGALARLHEQLIQMGELVCAQIGEAVNAYAAWDADSARLVKEREKTVNLFDDHLDEDHFALIALRSPVATDLRAIVAMSKAVAELERAGDEAKKIARTVHHGSSRPAAATARDVQHLGRLAVHQMHLAIQAFRQLDPAKAMPVIDADHVLDDEYAGALRRLIQRYDEASVRIEAVLEAAFVLKSIERVGDHARNLARLLRTIGRPSPPPAR
jgi:phosphate transport system protein